MAPDLKAWSHEKLNTKGETQARNWFENKLTVAQYAKWKPAMDRKNRDFYERKLEGKDLVRKKYQRYLQDYLSCAASVDDSVGVLLDYLDKKWARRKHGRDLQLRPRFLSGRTRLVRQAVYVRAVATNTAPGALAGDRTSGFCGQEHCLES